MKIVLRLFWLLVFCLPVFSQAQPLDMDQAYAMSAELFGDDTIVLKWQIAPEHYLYKDRFKFTITAPKDGRVGSIIYPPGENKEDATLGTYSVYTQSLAIPVPIIGADLSHTVLQVNYQGCAEDRYCYPPTTRAVQVNFNKRTVTITTPPTPSDVQNQTSPNLKLLCNCLLKTPDAAEEGIGVDFLLRMIVQI